MVEEGGEKVIDSSRSDQSANSHTDENVRRVCNLLNRQFSEGYVDFEYTLFQIHTIHTIMTISTRARCAPSRFSKS